MQNSIEKHFPGEYITFDDSTFDGFLTAMTWISVFRRNADDARLNPDDEAKVRSLLEYHPRAEEKKGSGIDYIKVKITLALNSGFRSGRKSFGISKLDDFFRR